MKECLHCKKQFELINKHGGQNRIFCYDCFPMNLSKKEGNQLRDKLFLDVVKREKVKIGCSICGYNRCANALEWHHKDADSKLTNPSNLSNGSYKKYKEETEKCVLLCANCHREVHSGIVCI